MAEPVAGRVATVGMTVEAEVATTAGKRVDAVKGGGKGMAMKAVTEPQVGAAGERETRIY